MQRCWTTPRRPHPLVLYLPGHTPTLHDWRSSGPPSLSLSHPCSTIMASWWRRQRPPACPPASLSPPPPQGRAPCSSPTAWWPPRVTPSWEPLRHRPGPQRWSSGNRREEAAWWGLRSPGPAGQGWGWMEASAFKSHMSRLSVPGGGAGVLLVINTTLSPLCVLVLERSSGSRSPWGTWSYSPSSKWVTSWRGLPFSRGGN